MQIRGQGGRAGGREIQIPSENIFHSDIFKYERGLTKRGLNPKHELSKEVL